MALTPEPRPKRVLPADHGARSSAGQLTNLSAEQRRSRARLAAHVQWSKTPDRTARTQAARDAFMRRFVDQVDPERRYPPDVRAQMAESAMRAYFVGIRRKVKKAGRDATR